METAFEAAFLVLMLWIGLIGIVAGAIEESEQRRAEGCQSGMKGDDHGHS